MRIEDVSYRAEINPQPRESCSGLKLVIASQWVRSCNGVSYAKECEVKDVVFSKKRGLAVEDMAKSRWVYRKLKKFRAGIEANISTLKRSYGLSRCNWSGWEGFKQYVWSAIVSYNLLVLARLKLARA